MVYEDASQNHSAGGSETVARADVETLAPGSYGPASGNAITGAGTATGASGADKVATPPGTIVEVHGAGGATAVAAGNFQAVGQYGVLSMDTTGNFNYVRNAGTPDGVRDVFNYTLADSSGGNSSTTLTIDIGQVAAAAAGQGVVSLPAGVELSDIHVNGRDLIVNLPDGTQMVIPNGAVFVPDIVIGDVQVPPTNLAALLVDSEPQPAAGPPLSPGGNWDEPPPPLDPGVPLGDLIPPTELSYSPPEFKEPGQFENTKPTVVFEPHDLAPGAVDAVDQVNEKGLPSRDGDLPNEPAGSGEIADGNGLNNSDTSETTNGAIVFTAQDGLSSITIDGVDGNPNNVVTITDASVGTTIQGQYGVMTITGVDLANGTITYTYTLSDNTHGDSTADLFNVVVTDRDGDQASASLTIDIIDDVPTARNDTDQVDLQTETATGNVVTGADTTSGASGADTVGADNATVSGVHPGTSGGFTTVGSGGVTVIGTFGDLHINTDGSYTYTLHEGAEGGGTDVFTYQLTDGDGDTSTATLTISNPDLFPTGGTTSTSVDEDGLNNGIAGGPGDITVADTDGDNNEATNAGTLPGSGGNGQLTFDLLTTGAPDGFQYVDGPNGSIIVQQDQGGTWVSVMTVTVDAHTGAYTVTLTAPMDHPVAGTEDSLPFTINYTVTDADNDSAPGTLNITVNDDSPQVTGVEAGAGVSVDETDAGSPAGFPISATSASAVITGTIGYGADGPGTTVYGLNITGGDGTSSGLATAIGDHPITLVQTDPSTITGTYQDGGTQTAFTIHINTDGTVTLTENVPLEHLVDGGPPAYNDTLDLSGLINATITVTDADNDSASGSVAIGGNIVFYDDGPSITVTASSDANVTLETQDAQTIGTNSDTDHSSANFSGVFSIGSSSGGGDGAAGSPVWAYTLGVTTSVSGLTSHGDAINLYLLANGEVVGSTSGTAPLSDSDPSVVFTVTVASDGTVTLTQLQQIDHPAADDPTPTGAPFEDQSVTILNDHAITLTGTATVYDNDGDHASDTQTIDIGSNLVFDDDGPTVSATLSDANAAVVDESPPVAANTIPIVDGYTVGNDPDLSGGLAIGSGSTSSGVIDPNAAFGADGPAASASLVYSLTIGNGGVSGLTTTEGTAIDLVMLSNGVVAGVVHGTTTVAFAIEIDPSTGVVTVEQYLSLNHPDFPTNYDEAITLATNAVSAVVTATDYDGDTATSNAVDIHSLIQFHDDGPLAVNDTVSQPSENATFSFDVFANDTFGADGVNIHDASKISFTQPAHGTISYDAATGLFTFTPEAGQQGSVTFTYTITDGDKDTSTATVTINLASDSTPTPTAQVAYSDDDGLPGNNPASTAGDIDANQGETPTTNPSEAIYNGQLSVNFHNDAPGTITFANLNGTTGTVGTETVSYSWNAGTDTLTATTVGGTRPGTVLFDIHITNEATGTYTLTQHTNILQAPGGNETSAPDVVLHYLATDSDNSTSTAGTLTIIFNDDAPTAQLSGQGVGTVTLDETRPEGSDTASGTTPSGDASNTINLAAAFVTGGSVHYGADGAASTGAMTYALHLSGSNIASGLYALDNTDTSTSDGDGYGQGGQIVLNQSGNTITGSYNGVNYFTITIDPTTGIATFTQLHNIWNPTPGSDAASLDELALLHTLNANDMTVIQSVTDADGDTSTVSFNIGQNVFGIQDDGPRFGTVDTTLTVDNTTAHPTGTGDMQIIIGTDSPNGGTGNQNPDDLSVSNFAITVAGNAATNVVLTAGAENATTASYTFAFDYDTGTGGTDHETGTLVFDKVAGTYTVTLDHPVQSFSLLDTAGAPASAFINYDLDSSSTSNSPSDVATVKLADNFFLQFSGTYDKTGSDHQSTTSGDTTYLNGTSTTSAGTSTYGNLDLFSQANATVTVSSSAAGVAGNTIQGGEVLDFNLYTTDQQGFLGNTPDQSATSMFIKLDGIGGSEDMIVILKVYDTSTHQYSTVALMVQNGDIITSNATLANTAYSGIALDSNDGVIIIEPNDYQQGNTNLVIVGAQIAGSDDGITGTAINFNGAIGSGGGSSGTQAFSTDVSDAPFKITDIGFVTQTTQAQAGTITFDTTIHDADGDTATTSVTVNIGTQSAAAINTLSLNTTDTTNTTNHNLVDTKSLLASNDNTGDHRAFNVGNTTALMGAIAAAGITQTDLSIHQSFAPLGDSGASVGTTSIASETLAPSGAHFANNAHHTELFTQAPLNGGGHAGPVNTQMPTFNGDFHGSVGGDPGIIDRSELPQGAATTAGTHGPAITSVTAASVVMPSAQQLAGAHGHGQVGGQANTVAGNTNAQHDEVVGKVLADALHGGAGHGPSIDTLLNSLPGHAGANAGVQGLASHGLGAVPMGDIGHFGGFAMFHMAPMMEQMIVHQAAAAHS